MSLPLQPGQVWQSNDAPEHVWVVLEVKPGSVRGAYLSVRKQVAAFVKPGDQFEIASNAFNLDGLTRIS